MYMEKTTLQRETLKLALETLQIGALLQEKKEFILSKQLIRSGTSIGALISEAKFAESRKDFIHKYHIALKEANETNYWLELLTGSGKLDSESSVSIQKRVGKVISILVKSIKTLKSRPDQTVLGG